MAALLDLDPVLKARKAKDHLSLRSNQSVHKLLRGFAAGKPEEVRFSDFIVKINPQEKPQERVLLITNKAIYNLLPSDYGRSKRRIAIEMLGMVTVSQLSDEFVLHVPSEYDYRLMSLRKREVIECLQQCYKECTGRELEVNVSQQIVLKSLCVTKKQAKANRNTMAGAASAASSAFAYFTGQSSSSSKPTRPAPTAGAGSGAAASSAGSAKGDGVTGWGTSAAPAKPEDFELLKVIGRGSFGKVMQVRKKGSPKVYAMKILRKEAIIERNQVEHTKAEREILEKIDHPFLMKMHYAFQTPTKLYFVMDMITGGELFFHLKNERRFNEERSRFYTAEIMLGLEHLHLKNIIYRDLKPENILLDSDGHVVLTDFGLSKKFTKGEKAQTFCGTPEYLAPEVVIGAGHGKEVDWWSLGILLYEMMVGLPPFYSENTNLMYELIQKASLRLPSFLSFPCRDIIKCLLKRDPRERLGYGDKDAEPIKAHQFFTDLDFEKLVAKKIKPSFVPRVKSATDTSNFDVEFTSEKVVDSVVPTSALLNAKGADFQGFTFKEKSTLGGI